MEGEESTDTGDDNNDMTERSLTEVEGSDVDTSELQWVITVDIGCCRKIDFDGASVKEFEFFRFFVVFGDS